MSSTSPPLPPGKTRRSNGSGKGRFDPSEPLHMTTRTAARIGRTNGTPSINGSVEDDDSRRGSLDDFRPTTSQSLGSQTGRRISGSSANGPPSAEKLSFEMQSPLDEKVARSGEKSTSPVLQPASPSRKRKRSSPTPPDTPNGFGDLKTPPTNSLSYLDTEDAVQVVPDDELSDREPTSSESNDPFMDNYLGVAQSTELTPAATPAGSEAVSPISEMSNSGVGFPNKSFDMSMVDADQQVEPDDPEEADDAEDLPEIDEVDDMDDADVDDADDQDEQDRVDGKRPHRLAGRRRADHHQADIEATMRRQLQLKAAYRSIARALKPVLAEISLKTVEGLEANPVLHEQTVEYQGDDDEPGIQAILDRALERRRAQLAAQHKWTKILLDNTLESEREVRTSKCELQVEDLRQMQIDALEHDLLTVVRQAQINEGESTYETEDEDEDVIPRPHRVGYRFARAGALDPVYDSRSRLALESERALRDLGLRIDMHKMLEEVYAQGDNIPRPGFTVMDDAPRKAADGKRESIRVTGLLADAAAEAERRANYKPIPNEEALGLQMLGDLASRPSIRAATQPPVYLTPRRDVDPFGPLLHQTMPPPPPLRAPIALEQPLQNNEVAHREGIHLPGPPVPSHPEVSMDKQQWENPFLSPKPAVRISPRASGVYGSEQSPRRQSVSQLPPLGPGVFGQSPLIQEDFDHSQSCAPTPTREESHREHYQRPLTMERETRQSPDRVLHDFSSGPLSIERVKAAEEPIDSRPPTQYQDDQTRDGSPTRFPLQAAPYWEPPSSPGAADSRQVLDPLLGGQPQENPHEGFTLDPRSRASSIISQSTATEASPDETGFGDPARRRSKQKGQRNGSYSTKTSKTDRHGMTRKSYSSKNAREKGGPQVIRFRVNPDVGSAAQSPVPQWPPTPFAAPPPSMAPDFYGPHQQYPAYYPPMHPHFNYPYQHPPEYGPPPPWDPRNGPPPPGTPHSWSGHPHPHPPSPLYAVPPGAPPPPPLPEQWPGQMQYSHPPPGPQTPAPMQAPLAAAPYPQKTSGQPLAPNTDSRSYSGGPPSHLPAFAQQQRQSEGVRRRAQSDTQHTKFKQYQPRPG